jgi:hypothetical protein
MPDSKAKAPMKSHSGHKELILRMSPHFAVYAAGRAAAGAWS